MILTLRFSCFPCGLLVFLGPTILSRKISLKGSDPLIFVFTDLSFSRLTKILDEAVRGFELEVKSKFGAAKILWGRIRHAFGCQYLWKESVCSCCWD